MDRSGLYSYRNPTVTFHVDEAASQKAISDFSGEIHWRPSKEENAVLSKSHAKRVTYFRSMCDECFFTFGILIRSIENGI